MNEREIIGVIETKSELSLPVWSVSNYLDNTMSNYLKLMTLRELSRKFIEGASDEDFLISVNSYDIFPMLEGFTHHENELIILTSKDRSPKDFWYYFRHLHRPIVLFRSNNGFIPLYEINTILDLRINSLSVQSPVSFSLQGSLGVLVDLFAGKIFAQRENERNALAIDNLERIVRTSHLIEDNRTPQGVREYAVDQIEAIMNKQVRINDKLGIDQVEIRR